MKLNIFTKRFTILCCSILAMTAMSCKDDFLDEDLTNQYSTDYFLTPQGLEDLTVSLYGNIRWHFGYEWAYGITLYGTDEFTNANDLTNEMWNTYDNRLGPVGATTETGAANKNATSPAALWDQMYYGISSANIIIANAEIIEDEAVRNRCLAHAYFLRGYNYYRLVAQYGGVVLQLEPAEGVVRNFERATEEESWEQVISDFRNAYEHFEGEIYTYGKGVTWTKATAAHFLAKALLFRASERNDAWNSGYIDSDLNEAIDAASYAIDARGPLTDNYRDLYATWSGIDSETEQLDEILMAAPHNADESTKGRFGNRTYNYFTPQFSNFSGGWVRRGVWIGGMDFQRLRPTEYTYAVFDHVNDSRMWKTFKTVYGVNNVLDENVDVELGDPGIVMILNTKDDDTYDNFKFGANIQQPDWRDVDGRLPEWKLGMRQTETSGSLTSSPGQFVPNSLVLYQNGEYVSPNFKSTPISNFFAGINKTDDGSRFAEKGDAHRDVTMARLAETYLVRAECYARLQQYGNAMNDINTVRARAAWKSGENRSYYVDGSVAFENNSLNTGSAAQNYINSNLNINTYYLSNPDIDVTTEASDLSLTSFPDNLPDEDEAVLNALGVSGTYDRALHFILNERTRELLGEWQRWETLSRTGTLIQRARAFNKEATNITENKHELRPIPQSFIDGLLNEDGSNLSAEMKADWQNPGY
ncbi:putative outer membrane starch-binding protein [Leeuwenhoekiella aestuarii]|uniref:Putative outer membrane starch-binding protein n=1 Tax=Leeuwenhoekiella aestuarii TaxID=2249426 RepID=A0A4Q0NSF4_9FLAO|nr:RagB/SusD family nutrient uptake outer membrane protein [Leeuwenhoekiella aestuarii]RXG12861.1 putative outer membrane starch-binding protein [Leeuwenhoekiella aestuarii]RXG13145.1 putative outer membrane starch-binding protein [Leeuwenhoekiella aestuarii]